MKLLNACIWKIGACGREGELAAALAGWLLGRSPQVAGCSGLAAEQMRGCIDTAAGRPSAAQYKQNTCRQKPVLRTRTCTSMNVT